MFFSNIYKKKIKFVMPINSLKLVEIFWKFGRKYKRIIQKFSKKCKVLKIICFYIIQKETKSKKYIKNWNCIKIRFFLKFFFFIFPHYKKKVQEIFLFLRIAIHKSKYKIHPIFYIKPPSKFKIKEFYRILIV